MFVTSDEVRGGLLVAVISGGRPRLDQRAVSRFLPDLHAAGVQDIVWVVSDQDAPSYEQDEHPLCVYPRAWALDYARGHWMQPQKPGPDAFLGAFPGREWACREAERRGRGTRVRPRAGFRSPARRPRRTGPGRGWTAGTCRRAAPRRRSSPDPGRGGRTGFGRSQWPSAGCSRSAHSALTCPLLLHGGAFGLAPGRPRSWWWRRGGAGLLAGARAGGGDAVEPGDDPGDRGLARRGVAVGFLGLWQMIHRTPGVDSRRTCLTRRLLRTCW